MWEQIIWEWVIWEWEDMGGGGNAYMGRGPLAETFYTNQIDIDVNDEDSFSCTRSPCAIM